VLLSTRCGDVVLRPDGRVERRAGRADQDERWPRGALDRSGDTYLLVRHGRLTVERRGVRLWRSTGRYRLYGTPHYLEATALGPRAVAFSFHDAGLYVAGFGRPERIAARGEEPLFWTPAGHLLTYRWDRPGSSLILRAADGSVLRRLPERMQNFAVAENRRSVVFATPEGRLVRTDGERVERLAGIRALGEPGIELPGGGLIVLHSDSAGRLLVLDSAGGQFGSTRLEHWPAAWAVSPDGLALAFVDTRWTPDYEQGTDAVLVLRRGGLSAVQVYERRHGGSPCGRGAALAWHGQDLLYSTTEGAVVALDSTGTRPPVDLTATVAELPGVWRSEGGAPRVSPEWAVPNRG
jgi:hypothetical protein